MGAQERNFIIISDLPKAIEQYAKTRIRGNSLKEFADALNVSEKTARDFSDKYSEQAYESIYPEILAGVKKYICSGNLTISVIAEKMGISIGGLKNMLSDLGIERKICTNDIEGYLKSGRSIAWIADYYGVAYLTLRKYMENNGLDHELRLSDKRQSKSTFPILDILSQDFIEGISAYDLNPQYTEKTDEIMSSIHNIHSFRKAEKQLLAIQRAFFADYESLVSEDACRKRYNGEYYIFSQHQYGIATKDNFYFNTMAIFTEVQRPGRQPDYVVENSRDKKRNTMYWFTKDGVIRGTRNWGPSYTDTCTWMIKMNGGEEYWGIWNYDAAPNKILYGKAKWTDFVFKTRLFDFGKERLCGFNNTCYGEINQYEGKNILSQHGHADSFFYSLRLEF